MEAATPPAISRGSGQRPLKFNLRACTRKRDIWLDSSDEIHARINEAFRREQIEIAFPQRDVHVRSIRDVLPVHDQTRGEPASPADD
jgi:small-conductance mechanosensitive channel